MNTMHVPQRGDVVVADSKHGRFTVLTTDQRNQTAMLGRLIGDGKYVTSLIPWADLKLVKKAG
jgi:hypothetical protein